jgi:hypothetical protein
LGRDQTRRRRPEDLITTLLRTLVAANGPGPGAANLPKSGGFLMAFESFYTHEQLFATANKTRVGVKWKRKSTKTVITPKGEKKEYPITKRTGGKKGICTTMCCMYLKKSFEINEETMQSADLGSMHSLAISHAVYLQFGAVDVATDNLLSRFSLKRVRTTRRQIDNFATTMDAVQQDGRYLIETPRHSMAYRKVNNTCYFFDPDFGLYRTASFDRFRVAFHDWLEEKLDFRDGEDELERTSIVLE